MISKNKNIATYTVLIAVFVVFVILSFLSEGGFYGGDSYNHYFLSRYAFKYPVFFLDNWAKPLFTVLSSLFAQFGFHGMMIFNIIAGILACFFAIKTALELKYMNSVLLVFFICFAPVFTMLLFSGMTEIVFALLLISSVYYFIKEKYIISAIIISFIPFIRAEGLVFIPWFMILLVIKKQYKAIPFLISGIFPRDG